MMPALHCTALHCTASKGRLIDMDRSTVEAGCRPNNSPDVAAARDRITHDEAPNLTIFDRLLLLLVLLCCCLWLLLAAAGLAPACCCCLLALGRRRVQTRVRELPCTCGGRGGG